MKIHSVVASAAASLTLVVAAGCTSSSPEDYPDDDVTFIIPAAPGGSTDPVGRAFARQLEAELGTSVVVKNRDGGGTTVGTNEVLQAEPDGYTIGMFIDSALALNPLQQDLPYEPDEAELIFGLAEQPANLAVPADAPWKSFADFISDAKKRPGEFQIANSGAQSVTDLEIRKLAKDAGIDVQSVPFGGGGSDALKALVGGQVDAAVGRVGTFAGDVEANNLRILATFRDKPFHAAPDATPTGELGLEIGNTPEYVGIGAPRELPPEVKKRLVEAAREVAESKQFQDFLRERGMEPSPQGPEEYQETINQTREEYSGLLKETGMPTKQG
ncbi:tripartite-type tricarboxylate transporter receptor subunit TctC [Tamaricihabitans halophyticus]|uniref:Tripartite-type tricarboxylate transporter receptor subunit TctC n=1 Tax=Tamaricihabitans halophyticus TaxID=1262583 RepID=A0A4R2R188_9PSEU|nr:tripartite tricarboxylate transporter substrate binding protein [Tamaricihabitans halophyticus]TCP55248.1 tripartite-type tricarboxylate transporter receptor subunit TctC [Tamaricihabitans halophyticus]